jgi:hypothetical protein
MNYPHPFKFLILFLALTFAGHASASCLFKEDATVWGRFRVLEIESASNSEIPPVKNRRCYVRVASMPRDQQDTAPAHDIELFGEGRPCDWKVGEEVEAKFSPECCDTGPRWGCDGKAAGRNRIDEVRERNVKKGTISIYSGEGETPNPTVVPIQEFDRNEDHYRQAQKSLNGSFCARITDQELKWRCNRLVLRNILEKSESGKDIELCKLFPSSEHELSQCIGSLALKYGKTSLCEQIPISKQGQIAACFEVAGATETECAQLQKTKYRDLCFSHRKICEKIQTSKIRDNCWQLAIQERWKSIGFEPALAACKSIRERINKDNCLTNLLYALRREQQKSEAFQVVDELDMNPSNKWDIYNGILMDSLKPGQAPDPNLCKELEKKRLTKPFRGCPN